MNHTRTLTQLAAVLTATLATLASLTGQARAQSYADEPVAVTDPGAGVPVTRTHRELVLPEGYVRGDLALSFGDQNGNFRGGEFFAHDLGGGISIIENLEFGISLNREWFWPRVGGGVLPLFWDGSHVHFQALPIYARYQFLTTEHVAIAGDIEMYLRTHAHGPTRHGFRASLPVRLRFDRFMIDTGFTFEAQTNDAQANLYVPAIFTINPTEALHIRASTGFGVLDMDGDAVFMPLFFGGGYSLAIGDILADINLDFGFPTLVHSAPAGGDHSTPQNWMVKLSVAAYIEVL
jgi:hypothetical protein